jgi:hypothetical protein
VSHEEDMELGIWKWEENKWVWKKRNWKEHVAWENI